MGGRPGEDMAQTLDIADFGFKDISTTGSMATGSNQLTIAAGAGFHVGDSVIVEVGGEAGGGLRGTVGVGGVDPAVDQSSYKGADVPKALTAKIVGISADGTVLTLDKSAATATSNAHVYYDNLPAWNAAVTWNDASPWTTQPDVIVKIPAGSFAVSNQMKFLWHDGWTIEGAGTNQTELFSPDGTGSVSMHVFQSPDTTVSDFSMRGNVAANGYGVGGYYPAAVYFQLSDNGDIHDLNISDSWRALSVDFSIDTWAHNVHATLSEGLQQYVSWQ